VWAVPRLCKFYPGICLTTEEKVQKNLSQGKKNLSKVNKNLSQCAVYILPKHPHITKPTHTHTNTHITKQYKTTTVQIKINTVQDIPKWNSHNIIECLQYKVTPLHIAPLPTTQHLYVRYSTVIVIHFSDVLLKTKIFSEGSNFKWN
jgi:hypothetical protein